MSEEIYLLHKQERESRVLSVVIHYYYKDGVVKGYRQLSPVFIISEYEEVLKFLEESLNYVSLGFAWSENIKLCIRDLKLRNFD